MEELSPLGEILRNLSLPLGWEVTDNMMDGDQITIQITKCEVPQERLLTVLPDGSVDYPPPLKD